ncbi:YkgJ family cysteine cluster protein [Methylomonas sp. EFPC1]|uniref:YkgJ family cysteine cluster protein n=1 Tax=Methylomonas sp. EFPC1 TaxID=2812647 RepID=UPI001967AA99|nr:YkgJ family cysteine cluster protein [Methylomonas sp. EFPC1]QSA99364.1 YkgJ family cysteine cluster protein [Methylomonas sp. EFPC1]
MSKTTPANVKLTLYGKPIELKFSAPTEKVTPVAMLPALHRINNTFVETAVAAFVTDQETISCQAGCGACCRQVVPLAEFEAYQIAGVVEQLPEPRRSTVKQRFSDACEKLDAIQWLSRLEQMLAEGTNHEAVEQHALTYFQQGVPCPFLEAESCSIHPVRPLACREYLVTSPAEHCQNPTPEHVRHIELKFQVSKIVRKLWRTSHIKDLDSVPMIYALQWVKKHPNQFPKKRGEAWLREFFDYMANP